MPYRNSRQRPGRVLRPSPGLSPGQSGAEEHSSRLPATPHRTEPPARFARRKGIEEMKKCIICGKKEGEPSNIKYIFTNKDVIPPVIIIRHKLPHGTIYTCQSDTCMRHLTLQLNDRATPVVWLSGDDLYNEDLGAKHMTEEEFDVLTADELLQLSNDTADSLWNCNFHDEFQSHIGMAVDGWREEKEKEIVKNTPKKELPLLIGALKYKRNIDFLEKRLKGG